MNERELFLYELDGRGFEFKDKTFNENGFNDDVLNMVYEMWQASANRQGYKLVPTQPSAVVIVAIEDKVQEQLYASAITSDMFRLDGEKIYYSAIDAVGN